MLLKRFSAGFAGILLASSSLGLTPARAESLSEALSAAYLHNPTINSTRAQVRAIDESVPLAKSSTRPFVQGSGSLSRTLQDISTNGMSGGINGQTVGALELTATQNLFRGFRTKNETRAAKADIMAAREQLRLTVQNTLFLVAQAYFDIVRDRALLDVARQNVGFLNEQVRAAQDRFNVGETTRTDVAQTRAELAQARSDINVAEANLASSTATYIQLVGRRPGQLRANFPIERYLPNQLQSALDISQRLNPAIIAARHELDAAAFDIKTVEGELLPTISLEASAATSFDFDNDVQTDTARIGARVSVPIYQGGAVSARVRQSKEILGQRRLEVDVAREEVRAAVISSFEQLRSAQASITAAQAGIEAAQLALAGIIEEQRVGQRTTLDVLNTQQNLLDARVTSIVANRNRIVAGFSLLSAIGKLSPQTLGLKTAAYQPSEHYLEVKDKWFGLRTPDGR